MILNLGLNIFPARAISLNAKVYLRAIGMKSAGAAKRPIVLGAPQIATIATIAKIAK